MVTLELASVASSLQDMGIDSAFGFACRLLLVASLESRELLVFGRSVF